MVDEGCLAVFGPSIADNVIPTAEAIEERFKVPCISVTGSDVALGEWFFAFPMGSHTDEPIFWADLLAKGGLGAVGVLKEQSVVGEAYLQNFRDACKHKGIRIVAEASIAQTAGDVTVAVNALHEAKVQAIVHCGFGFGVVFVNPALEALGWDLPEILRNCIPERLAQPHHVERVHGLDRGRPIRRGQHGRPEIPRRVQGRVRSEAGMVCPRGE